MADTTTSFTGRVVVNRVTKTTTSRTMGYNAEEAKTSRDSVEELDVTVRSDTVEGVVRKLNAAVDLMTTDETVKEAL